MNYIKLKDYTTKGCNVCSERRRNSKNGRYYCIHEECIFEETEELEWWKEVGGRALIPEGVMK